MLFPGGTKEMLYLWLWLLYNFLSVYLQVEELYG